MPHNIEVYGSLLNPEERARLAPLGSFRELGKERREGWKLSFDRFSEKWGEPVLNFVRSDVKEDVFYTTIFEVSDGAFDAILRREMGRRDATRWTAGRPVLNPGYRPVELQSRFGKTWIFIVPGEGRMGEKPPPTSEESAYVPTVRRGIELSYDGEMRTINLLALLRAIEESRLAQRH